MSDQDNYGYFGPDYSFADNVTLPGALGVRQEASVGAIMDSVSAINFYSDTIAFGSPTFLNTRSMTPMGIRYFLNTEQRCSNGATQSEYFDGVTKGDIMGSAVAAGLASAGLPGLKGLAPGMLENARDALDPRPIFAAVTGTGYSVCQQVLCPVGDAAGAIANADGSQYVVDPVQYVNGLPYQSRWTQAYDSTGAPIQISKDEFAATPKCYNADGSLVTPPPAGCTTLPGAISQQGTGKYGLCTVTQSAQMPPTIAAGNEGFTQDMRSLGFSRNGISDSREGFTDGSDTAIRLGAAAIVGVLGIGLLMALGRK
jgi:hypothetical protein